MVSAPDSEVYSVPGRRIMYSTILYFVCGFAFVHVYAYVNKFHRIVRVSALWIFVHNKIYAYVQCTYIYIKRDI